MTPELRAKIQSILDRHRTMTVATLRPDGWPHATAVGYGNDGFTLYFLCGRDSQKAANLARDDRVSITINDDPGQVMQIEGLSVAARARRVTDRAEALRAMGLMMERYPAQEGFDLPMPQPEEVAIFRVAPEVISVLDYSKGFAHTDLVTC
jgi:PPOX class probable F420-dependent enzyme